MCMIDCGTRTSRKKLNSAYSQRILFCASYTHHRGAEGAERTVSSLANAGRGQPRWAEEVAASIRYFEDGREDRR